MYTKFLIGLLLLIFLSSLYNITLYNEVCQDPFVTSTSHLDLFYLLHIILFTFSSGTIFALFITHLSPGPPGTLQQPP